MPPKKKAGKASGNPADGDKVFRSMCAACHSLEANSTGPALGGIVGENIASNPGYSYSNALSSKAT